MAIEEIIQHMDISFLTPFLNGNDMMRIHLSSIRKYFPDSPILIMSMHNDGMDDFKKEFNIEYWVDPGKWYVDAMKDLYEKCKTDLICISDHDIVLLDDIHYLIDGVGKEWDLVGIEERIHHPWADTWMRYAPGYMDMTFMIFNLKEFKDKFGIDKIKFDGDDDGHTTHEYHYGICQRLSRHKYLLPYHTEKYGMGNLIKDGDKNILWHQWYGSYRVRPITAESDRVYHFGGKGYLEKAEAEFLKDYPNLELNLRPAYDDR